VNFGRNGCVKSTPDGRQLQRQGADQGVEEQPGAAEEVEQEGAQPMIGPFFAASVRTLSRVFWASILCRYYVVLSKSSGPKCRNPNCRRKNVEKYRNVEIHIIDVKM
jgi:hypothetical protein